MGKASEARNPEIGLRAAEKLAPHIDCVLLKITKSALYFVYV